MWAFSLHLTFSSPAVSDRALDELPLFWELLYFIGLVWMRAPILYVRGADRSELMFLAYDKNQIR